MSRDDEIRERLRALKVFEGELATFDIDQAPGDPADLFCDWLEAALDADVREPHAMTLSTVDAAGRPTSRVLILKGLDDGRWHFASSSASRKGKEIATNPWAAANFYWPQLGRQVRLRGRILDAGPDASARDFLARPPGSRAETLAGNQSAPLNDPADLEQALAEAHARIHADPELVPEHWTLYHLLPDEVEFWQAHPERRHTRLRYRLDNGRWTRQTVWP
jgi:pyridoxamine 5'-phosphate oxidase